MPAIWDFYKHWASEPPLLHTAKLLPIFFRSCRCCWRCRRRLRRAGHLDRTAQSVEERLGHLVEVRWFLEDRFLHLGGVAEVVAADVAFLQYPQHGPASLPCGGPCVVAVGEFNFAPLGFGLVGRRESDVRLVHDALAGGAAGDNED